jgi:starch phosphorylase
VKQANKRALAANIADWCGVEVDPQMLFDVQVKRIHEYKRQLLNVLHVIHLYARIKAGDTQDMCPRCVIIGGKAAPGYVVAKTIIKLVNNVAKVVNRDPATAGLLRLVFVPDYNVSKMEVICPAADLSAQISTAGKEASGTGNMKFMLNGAVTIGTLDGANVEIREAVGADNFFLFGLHVDEIDALRPSYDPVAMVAADAALARVMKLLADGHFNRFEPGLFDGLIHGMLDPNDQWMTIADLRSFIDAQQQAGAAYLDQDRWLRMSILNTASGGRFSTDRTMRDYNREIWRLTPIEL